MGGGGYSFYKVKEPGGVKKRPAPGTLPARVGNRSLLELMEADSARGAAWGAQAPVQRKWLHFRNSLVLRADRVGSGLLWYYNLDTGKMWYKIEEPRAVEGLTEIQGLEGEENQAEYGTWLIRGFQKWEDFDDSVEENPSGSLGRFGMELEMIPEAAMGLTVNLDTVRGSRNQGHETAVDEGDIKGTQIFPVAGGLASMTLDTRNGYDEMARKVSVVPELVFDSTRIDLNDDLETLGRRIYEDLKDRRLSECVVVRQVTPDGRNPYVLEVSMHENGQGRDLTFGKITTFNVHITVAMPLKALWDRIVLSKQRPQLQVMRAVLSQQINYALEDYHPDNPRLALDSASKAFIAIFKSLFLSPYENPDEKADPKQQMNVMNRTSFGRMFTLLTKDQQVQVLNFIYRDLMDNPKLMNGRLTKAHPISMKDMYIFLWKVYYGKATSHQDPTYKANHGDDAEKLGASHLGERTEEVGPDAYGGSTAPVLEFRGVVNFQGRLDQLPHYLRKIQDDMRKILTP